jgi:mono/diheme cytochrome c family protein
MNIPTATRPLLAMFVAAGVFARAPAATPAGGAVDFNRDVLPILSGHCFKCHGPDEKTREAKLRLDTREGALRTRDPVIVPGRPAQSELLRRITAKDPNDVMPPPEAKHKPNPAQVETLRRWIAQGAKWATHWAWTPPRRPAVPAVQSSKFKVQGSKLPVRNEVDHFLLARLAQEGLSPSPEAAPEALIRRVTLDLTGLPPTPAEVDAFLRESQAERASDKPYEALVDRLLASPRYGERMVWDWLDAARYADSNGYQGDGERTMWPWRDWAVQAMNDNMPFDQFTVWQIAGDLLPDATREQKLATGFNRNHMINGEGGRIAEENRVDYIFDQLETTATVWLGVTIGCSRCHDHKFDPLTMRDYYGLFAFFNGTPVAGGGGSGQTAPVMDFVTPEQTARLEKLRQDVVRIGAAVDEMEPTVFPRPAGKASSDSTVAKDFAAEPFAALKQKGAARNLTQLRGLAKLYKDKEPADYAKALADLVKAMEDRDEFNRLIPRVMVMEEMPKPRDTFMLVRGLYNKPTEEKVAPAFPASLAAKPGTADSKHETNRQSRLDLARWLVAQDNPLTARVTVNRAWQRFFGTGLVKTTEDFGVQGEKPSHPELLDWLATEFVRTGWDVKRLHKLIVMSAAYRQSSRVTPALLERDPENRLLARGPRQRLPSWMLRDQALAVSGLLVDRRGGPPVKPYQPAGVWEEATFGNKTYKQDHGEALYRRSLYVFWRRIIGPTMFFDVASRQNCTVKTPRTNTPLHALVTLNDVTFVEAARAMAERVLKNGAPTDARIEHAFRLATSRKPSPAEADILTARLDALRRQFGADKDAALKLLKVGESPRDEKLDAVEHAAWASLCSLLLNLDEALTKP